MNKKDGSIVVEVTVIFSITLILILVVYATTIGIIRNESEIVSDDLISSELAAYKSIDTTELGASQGLDTVIITNHEDAFNVFKEYLKLNLNLDDSFKPINEYNFIKEKVDILLFTIYNVKNNDVEIITYNTDGYTVSFEQGKRGIITTPKGNKVINTTIYAEIGFYIKPMFLEKKYIVKSEETDILVSNEGD